MGFGSKAAISGRSASGQLVTISLLVTTAVACAALASVAAHQDHIQSRSTSTFEVGS